MAKERGRAVITSNRKARHDYHIEDTFEAGLALTGTEVKALRMGRASLADGFAQFTGDELWLEGVHIPEYSQGTWTNHAPRRRRKLLLHREELRRSPPRRGRRAARSSPSPCTGRTDGPRSRSPWPRASGSTTSATRYGSGRTAGRRSGR